MRRLFALILLFIFPVQFAWSAVMGVHVHVSGDDHAVGAHFHDHDPHAGAHLGHGLLAQADGESGDEGDHHVSHCHHVYPAILAIPGLTLCQSQSGTAPSHPATRFSSHTPLLDPPPPARA